MDPECARIDQLCLRVAAAEWRVVSEFSSFLHQSCSFKDSQSSGLNGKRAITCLNLLIL